MSLDASAPSVDIVTYLCPDPWVAPGITYPEGNEPMEVSEDEALKVVEVTARLTCHIGDEGERAEVRAYLIRTNFSELACTMCGRARFISPDNTEALLVQRINVMRESRPPECEPDGCYSLQLDPRVRAAANLAVVDAANGTTNYWSSGYFQGGGVSYTQSFIFHGFIAKPGVTNSQGVTVGSWAVTDDDLGNLLDEWAGFHEGYRGELLRPEYTRAGVAFRISYNPRGWYVALAVADIDVQTNVFNLFDGIPPTEWACSFTCMSKLQYYRRKIVQGRLGNPDILDDFITFRFQLPLLCNLWGYDIVGDVRGARRSSYGGKGEIPQDKADFPLYGGREIEFRMNRLPPYPGEFFTIRGYLQGIYNNPCNPIIVSAGYFAHFCYTSGRIVGILLYDGGVVEERTSGSTPDEWIGDVRLRYRARCEGILMLVVPSDFARYSINDRVVIHKGGKHTLRSGQQEAGCQDPEGATPNDLLRWDLVRDFPDHADGEIVPQNFWGI